MSRLFGRVARFISKFMTSQLGSQINVIRILPNISKSKGNQTKKFDQLIKYNMRNIFLQKSYTKCGTETSARPFSEKWKLSISLDQMQFIFIVCQAEGYQSISKLDCIPLAFTSFEAFLKNKKTSGTSAPTLFSA